jgi:hypothetical protein
VSVVAALLAVAITLLFATAVGDLHQSGAAGSLSRQPAAVSAVLPRSVATPSLTSDPFTGLLRESLPQPAGRAHQ